MPDLDPAVEAGLLAVAEGQLEWISLGRGLMGRDDVIRVAVDAARSLIEQSLIDWLVSTEAVEAGARAGVGLSVEVYGGEVPWDELSVPDQDVARDLADATIRAAVRAVRPEEGETP